MLTLLLAAKLAFAGPSVTVVVDQPPLVRALYLPIHARRLRHAGVSAVEVRTGLEAVRIQRVRAWDAVVVFEESVVVTRKHGHIPHFGIFLEQRLSRGVRGPDLVHALVVEHESYGDKHKHKDKDWNNGHGPNDVNHGGKHNRDDYDRHVLVVSDDHGKSWSGNGRGNSGKGHGSSGKGHGNSGHGNGKKNGKGKD